MARELWVGILVGIIGGMLGLIMNHFLPMFLKLGDNVPKGSFGWPILGETLGFLKPHPSNTIGAFLQDHCSRYGNVFKSHLFFSPTVVSCDQELNYFILQNEGKLFQCSYPKPIHGILGNVSMLVAVGDTHKRLRNVAISLVMFCEEARKFSFNVIIKQVLGLTSEEPETGKILEDFLAFMRGLVSIPLYIPGTPYARAVQARSRISSRVKAIIEERRSGNGRSCGVSNDFLEILLCVDTLSEDEKVSFVLDSLLGGYETTSLLMAMVVHLLGQSPTASEQLKLEHEQIRSSKERDEFLNWEDYKKMGFTQNVINEALRYGNIVKFVHRKALKDVKFRDHLIPSGWKVLPVFTAVHLDSSVHADALQFHPWRWEAQDQTCKKFTPFGGGSRCCPGSELAKIEIAFFLHHLLQNFRWTAEDVDQPMAYPYVEFGKGLLINLDRCSI
ncbi:hypothetical protein OIU78_014911 [Salix suchowensis]|nr:hypothetical protein OIU78_014911 [Salix suchowensis]